MIDNHWTHENEGFWDEEEPPSLDCLANRIEERDFPAWFRDRNFDSPWHSHEEPVGRIASSPWSGHFVSDAEEIFQVLRTHIGSLPKEFEPLVDIGVETFTLSERFQENSVPLTFLWQHSIRTGYMAALISKAQHGDSHLAWEAFVGGLLHDIGHVVFLTQYPSHISQVIDVARKQGKSISLAEKHLLGISHGEIGVSLLNRWGIKGTVPQIVEWHDEPFHIPGFHSFSLTAVYIANELDGGGFPQDGDGAIGVEGEIYLKKLGLWDCLPLWQSWRRAIPLEPA